MPEIFQFDFMIRALIAGMAVAVLAPLIGLFLVVKRYSLMADTLAHISLLGVAVGFLINVYPFFTALLLAVISALGMEKLRTHKSLPPDSILALFLSGSLAVTVVLLSIARGFNVNLLSFLFGSITTVTPQDIYLIIILTVAGVAIILTFYKELFLISLDEELAQAGGLRTRVFDLSLMALAALTVSLAIKIVGVLLIGALMVIPVMAAMQFRRGFVRTHLLSILFSMSAVVAGIFVSYYLNWPSGGTIVIMALVIFLGSMVFNSAIGKYFGR